jgi:hypothetical protein
MKLLYAFVAGNEGKAPEAYVIFAVLIAIIAVSLGVLIGPGEVGSLADIEDTLAIQPAAGAPE